MPVSSAQPKATKSQRLEAILGYLNFSSGAEDAAFLGHLTEVFGELAGDGEHSWQRLKSALLAGLEQLAAEKSSFADCDQARRVIELVWDKLLPAYRQFHSDLLFHQPDNVLFRPLFIGRACEAVLREGSPWNEADRIVEGALQRLNDYVGHRPIPALESHRHEPYAHERVRPIPLYVQGAGIDPGPYHDVIAAALEILESTDEDVLRDAHFSLDLLSELAVDPRAYDFEHPANKRPNYHFGQWDPHCIDGSGRYRRLVMQQVTLDAVVQRVNSADDLPTDEAIFEGGAVLAGTMLMATGVSGWGPEAHDSETSLNTLLPIIAGYRDVFYERLIASVNGGHGERLAAEAKRRRQPFAASRQALNAALTSRRASQLSHVYLAKTFASMGYHEAAIDHANVVPAASARILCQIDCRLTTAEQSLTSLEVATASNEDIAKLLAEVGDMLRGGIQCGAIIDPWNILGFDAHYSLFPAMENSIRDFRADDLCEMVERTFNIYATAWCRAAADDDGAASLRLESQFRELAEWWHQFAAHEVSSIEAPHGPNSVQAAAHAAEALNQWHKAGAESGDLAFWSPHADEFGSAKAYVMVIGALLDHRDHVASMALLVHWLSQSQEVGLRRGVGDFSLTATQWMQQVLAHESPEAAWTLIRRLFERLEANADEYGEAPRFEVGESTAAADQYDDIDPFDEEEEDEEDSLFGAAYEGVVFRDSTDDGVDGAVFDYDTTSSDELEHEAQRIHLRLNYLQCLAHLWNLVAAERFTGVDPSSRQQPLAAWSQQATHIAAGLDRLAEQVAAHHLAAPRNEMEAMIDFDRRRSLKENIAEQVMNARVNVTLAQIALRAASGSVESPDAGDVEEPVFISVAVQMLAAIHDGDRGRAIDLFEDLVEASEDVALLYVPITRGGTPQPIIDARINQQVFQQLVSQMPRLGMLLETRRLLDVARRLERETSVGPGAVTEFDDLFRAGVQAMVDCVIASIESWPLDGDSEEGDPLDEALIGFLERLTQAMIESWLAHSRTLRLSVLERVNDDQRWKQLVRFIKKYGDDLFTQQFLNLGNLRAIQHAGVGQWLEEIEAVPYMADAFKLVGDLDEGIPRRSAVRYLSLIIEAIIENYVEYRDYNATTTQSDRGECLYMLLDFIRLRMQYDRIAWNLRPVILTHELLVRRGRNHAAQMWQRALAERFQEEAEQFQKRQAKLEKKYAMKMPTVADRLAEKFVLPMTIDRLCALVEPAIEEAQSEGEKTHFSLLEQEANVLVDELGGVGLDLPAWLAALDDEVQKVTRPDEHAGEQFRPAEKIEQLALSREEMEEIFVEWET